MLTTPTRRYSTDLTDEQWELIRPLVDREWHMGRPTTIDLREVVNALLYLNRTGCPWRLLPSDFPQLEHRAVLLRSLDARRHLHPHQ